MIQKILQLFTIILNGLITLESLPFSIFLQLKKAATSTLASAVIEAYVTIQVVFANASVDTLDSIAVSRVLCQTIHKNDEGNLVDLITINEKIEMISNRISAFLRHESLC